MKTKGFKFFRLYIKLFFSIIIFVGFLSGCEKDNDQDKSHVKQEKVQNSSKEIKAKSNWDELVLDKDKWG